MIFISSGFASQEFPENTINNLLKNNIKYIELSGGKFSKNLLQNLYRLKPKAKFQFHNYFPPPKKGFVLNLASSDKYISSRSIKHIYKAIDWSNQIGSKYYSIHAGFQIDLNVNEIGKVINKRKLYEKKKSINLFIKRLNKISKYAKNRKVGLLIENNVVSKKNFIQFRSNPFLMSTPEECQYIMKNTDKNINMLLDVGHLKVSAKTLGFDISEMFLKCNKWIKAYHLSDNDGFSDLNKPFNKNSWFWKYLKKKIKFSTIEVYNIDYIKMKSLYYLTCAKLSNN